MSTASQIQSVLIGTAGHIDHGKTRLVARLTGIDTDRLPEEKARGISIDLGFAHWEMGEFRFGVVDVPGHERFVRTMVAGATGVNLALLVVAADDGVMPQTVEHLEIMDLLGLESGVVAVTKTDLVDEELVELIISELEDRLAGTFLEGCPIVPVSSETGQGLDELKDTLFHQAQQVQWPERNGLFRMPIDRVFSIAGHGTIVTGSVHSGEVHAGDTLELLPQGESVRVRSVERHNIPSEETGARQRAALNLAGVKTDDVARGAELVTPGWLRPTVRLVVEIKNLRSSPIVLRDRMRLAMLLGTKESAARLITKGRKIAAGETGYAELRLEEPVVASYGQRFILRRISPALTIAGGRILDPRVEPGKRIKDLDHYAKSLDTPSEIDRLAAMVARQDRLDASPLTASWQIGIPVGRYEELVAELENRHVLTRLNGGGRPIVIHEDRLRQIETAIMRAINAELQKHQPRRALPKNTLVTACRDIVPPDLLDAMFDELVRKRQLVRVGANLGPAEAQVSLTKKQQSTREAILDQINRAGISPPTIKELSASLKQPAGEIQTLLNLCVEDELLVKVEDSLYFAPEALEQARGACAQLLGNAGQATASQLREAWGTSRKYSVPICEFFDVWGVTVRDGDVRRAGPNIDVPLSILFEKGPKR